MPLTTDTRVTLPSALDLSTGPRFASRADCELALALVPHEALPDARVELALPDVAGPVTAAALGLDRCRSHVSVLHEGPRWYVEISPGVLAVRRRDPARADRAAERAHLDARARADELLTRREPGQDAPASPLPPGVSGIRSWSRKSRARMRRRLAQLDYTAPAAVVPWAPRSLGMLTLTYPGEWLSVAPSAHVCAGHLRNFRKRFERRWGPLFGVWKREFQGRGAPHFHIGGLWPTDPGFPAWARTTWAEIVDHQDPEQYRRHALAGTRVDFAKGRAATDPRRFADYFAKHGAFAAKEYQNRPPVEWSEDEGVGRFWGVWRFEALVVSTEVAPDVARTITRTTRRWVASHKQTVTRLTPTGVMRYTTAEPMMRVERWRKVTTVDRHTGELGWKWRKRRTLVPVRRFQRASGFIAHSDAPGLLEALSRAAVNATTPRRTPPGRVGRSGLGPVGFLP